MLLFSVAFFPLSLGWKESFVGLNIPNHMFLVPAHTVDISIWSSLLQSYCQKYNHDNLKTNKYKHPSSMVWCTQHQKEKQSSRPNFSSLNAWSYTSRSLFTHIRKSFLQTGTGLQVTRAFCITQKGAFLHIYLSQYFLPNFRQSSQFSLKFSLKPWCFSCHINKNKSVKLLEPKWPSAFCLYFWSMSTQLAKTDGQDSHFLVKTGETTSHLESSKLTCLIIVTSSEISYIRAKDG